MEYRYGNSTLLPWAELTATDNLDDGSVGDTSTGETTSASDGATGLCRFLDAVSTIVGQARLGTVHGVTGFTARVRITNTLEALEMVACLVPEEWPPNTASASATLQGYIGGSWVDLYSQVLLSAYVPNDDQSYALSASWDEALTCELRLVVVYDCSAYTPSIVDSTLTVNTTITDLRVTASDTAEECSGSAGTGGEEPTPDPDPEEDCGCGDWIPGNVETTVYTPADASTTDWTPKRCSSD